ncbi:DUF3850 domain-containing protein [Listeria booriae]|uniref:DUF3850 domain-containing protein n=1 Tax=Listeria booriae TaxID=1552123 RepID=UPI00162896A4|nr:DUF3850 domain-containing protein [Listeria booriae]MBC2164642.1 DUF3850 domain-containing protein [Listeria booriae]
MKTHALKIYPEYFQSIWDRKKMFEIRKNDRGYQVGDFVVLSEYNSETGLYTGRAVSAYISYMTDYMQKDGYVVFGLEF